MTEDAEKLERLKAELELDGELIKGQRAAEHLLNHLYHQTITEVAKGSIERARDSAKFVQTAATAVVAIYSGLLALTFSVTDNPLPLRGIWAGAFLGLAIALSVIYLAWIRTVPPPPLDLGAQSLMQLQHERTAYISKWVGVVVTNRRWALRASVLCLAFGVLFIAAPFVALRADVDVPAVSEPPSVPANIAPEVKDEAARLFAAQLELYESSVRVHKSSNEKALKAQADNNSGKLDKYFACTALAAFIFALGFPWLYERWRWSGIKRKFKSWTESESQTQD